MNPSAVVATLRSTMEERYGPSRWLQPAWRAIAAEVGLDRGAFLDLASGRGWICIHVASGKPELDAVGIESSATRRAQAERNRERRLNCTFKDMALTELTWPDATFDAATAVGAAQTWAEPEAVLRETHRVLKPGGRLLVYDPLPDAEIPEEWVQARGGWPPRSVVRRYLRQHGMTDAQWERLKEAVRASPFKGGEEGRHGFYRRLVLRRA